MNETIVKHLNFGEDAKNKIFQGIETLTKAVSSTLGASGKCVIMENQNGDPQITKDGVTVANSIILLDPVENMGAKLIKEAARKTVKEAGDGTTTATVLACAILKEASKFKELNPRELKIGINKAVEKVIKHLEKNSAKVKKSNIEQVATISANNDQELGKIIYNAFISVGKDGLVIMETHDEPNTKVETIEGVQYEQGFSNPHFVTNKAKNESELNDCFVLIVDSPIENIRKIQNILEHIIKNQLQLLIIADVEPQVSSALAMNKIKGNIKVNIIAAPTYGANRKSTLDDLGLLTGAKVISEDLGDDLDLIDIKYLGKCKKVVSNTVETIIQIDSRSEEVIELTKDLEDQYNKTTKGFIKDSLEKRISRLKAKVAVVKVGANSEIELKEKRDRVEDAICATRAALKEGIVPGGGIALLNASSDIEANSKSEEVLLKAIKHPYETILSNAGVENYKTPTVNGTGLNVVTGETVNMVKSGIIDPLLVTKSALRNAASVATTIISTDCVINNLRA